MSTLDLIRSLRHALSELRDARDPDAIEAIARELTTELGAKLARVPPAELAGWVAAIEQSESESMDTTRLREIGMAVCA